MKQSDGGDYLEDAKHRLASLMRQAVHVETFEQLPEVHEARWRWRLTVIHEAEPSSVAVFRMTCIGMLVSIYVLINIGPLGEPHRRPSLYFNSSFASNFLRGPTYRGAPRRSLIGESFRSVVAPPSLAKCCHTHRHTDTQEAVVDNSRFSRTTGIFWGTNRFFPRGPIPRLSFLW